MASAYGNEVTNRLSSMFSPENVVANQNRIRQVQEQNSLASIMQKHQGVVNDASLSDLSQVSPEMMMKVHGLKQEQAKLLAERNKPVSMAAGGVLFDPVARQPIFTAPTKPEKPEKVPDWKDPAYLAYQRELERFKAGLKPSATQTAKKPTQMSAQAQKELFESDEFAQSGKNTIGMLQEALNLNKQAYSGALAKERAVARSQFGEDPRATATINLDNIMTSQALESLKSVFGGMPTEGERKILMDIQASADKTPAQRELIINRAIQAAERRAEFNRKKAESLRSGSYFTEGMQQPQQQNDDITDLLNKYQ